MTTKLRSDGYTCTAMFPNQDAAYEATDVAEFLNELSRLYNVALKFLRGIEPASIDDDVSHQELQILLNEFVTYLKYSTSEARQSEIEWAINSSGDGQYRGPEDIRDNVLKHFPIRQVEPYRNRIEPLKIRAISYNSPLSVRLSGLARPLIIAVIITGGEIDLLGNKVKMPGLVDSVIKIKQEFFSAEDHMNTLRELVDAKNKLDEDEGKE